MSSNINHHSSRAAPRRRGQSLIEVLVAVSIGMLLLVGGIAVIVSSVKTTSDTGDLRTAALLGRELLERVSSLAEADWWAAVIPPEGKAIHYYVAATSSPFSRVAGEETVTIATTTYTRYFALESVYRDAGGGIAESGTVDYSTKKIIVSYGVSGGALNTLEAYITRSRNRALIQTDWSGGGGVEGPLTVMGNAFASSSGVDVSTTTGSITIDL